MGKIIRATIVAASVMVPFVAAHAVAQSSVNEAFVTGAAEAVMQSISAGEFVAILSEGGLNASAEIDDNGDPMVSGNVDGINYSVFFHRCNADKQCLDMRFNANFNFDKRVTLHMMNVFNSRAVFGQAYIGRDGSVNIDMSATIQGGVTQQYVKEVIDWWRVTVTKFEENLFAG